MITIIHGDDVITSRKQYIEHRQKSASPLILDAKSWSLTDIVQAFEGGSLFGEAKKIFIENFFSIKQATDIISYLQKNTTHEIFFWTDKELTKNSLTIFPGAKVLMFKFPPLLFTFLDSLKPGHGQDLIKLFHNLLQNTEAELVFYMLVRQFRMLLALSPRQNNNIDEVKKLAPWQTSKLQNQARLFSLERLKKIYSRLYEIDLSQKTGKTALTLVQAVDFFLLDI